MLHLNISIYRSSLYNVHLPYKYTRKLILICSKRISASILIPDLIEICSLISDVKYGDVGTKRQECYTVLFLHKDIWIHIKHLSSDAVYMINFTMNWWLYNIFLLRIYHSFKNGRNYIPLYRNQSSSKFYYNKNRMLYILENRSEWLHFRNLYLIQKNLFA
jgi:hypothetical protein